jgi:hypothetical protein
MKRILFLTAILFASVVSFASVSPVYFSGKQEKTAQIQKMSIAIKLKDISNSELNNLEQLINEALETSVPLTTECSISITLEASIGVVKISGTATATAPTCKEAARVAAQGAKDALAAAKAAIM